MATSSFSFSAARSRRAASAFAFSVSRAAVLCATCALISSSRWRDSASTFWRSSLAFWRLALYSAESAARLASLRARSSAACRL